MMKVSILGSGIYAKAISARLLEAQMEVSMWTEQTDFSKILVKDGIVLTNSFDDVSRNAEIVFVLTGSKFVRSVLEGIAPYVKDDTLIILGSKGISEDGMLMSEIALDVLPRNPYAIISGPTFAVDIAALEPVGFTIATADRKDFERIKKCLITPHLEYSQDTLAIEMCGSLKNAYAIGSGILNGANYGHSTGCLYITEVLNEMRSIFASFGADPQTVNTLAGVGDLVLTCTSQNSRNYTFGTIIALGTDSEIAKYLSENTVEGRENLISYVSLFQKKGIDAPIMSCVYDIVFGTKTKEDLVNLLLVDR